jgi:hypothetical protein
VIVAPQMVGLESAMPKDGYYDTRWTVLRLKGKFTVVCINKRDSKRLAFYKVRRNVLNRAKT